MTENKLKIIKSNQAILKLIRPNQWIKNFFLFAPLFFSFSFTSEKVVIVCLGFLLFSLAASSIYVLNDYQDIEEDKAHPTKRNRPLASGNVTKNSAKVLIFGLILLSLFGSFILSIKFMAVIVFYIILNIAYTFKLKHISILDISIIAIGFVLRIYAGAVLIDNSLSMWIVLVTFILALFLALAKRRDDCLLALDGKKTRKNIDGYNLEMVNSAMSIMAGATIMSYIMYTVSPEVIERLDTHNLYLTSFFVIIGILRYMQITFVEQNSGSPTKIVVKDKFLQLTILSWIVSFILIVKIV